MEFYDDQQESGSAYFMAMFLEYLHYYHHPGVVRANQRENPCNEVLPNSVIVRLKYNSSHVNRGIEIPDDLKFRIRYLTIMAMLDDMRSLLIMLRNPSAEELQRHGYLRENESLPFTTLNLHRFPKNVDPHIIKSNDILKLTSQALRESRLYVSDRLPPSDHLAPSIVFFFENINLSRFILCARSEPSFPFPVMRTRLPTLITLGTSRDARSEMVYVANLVLAVFDRTLEALRLYTKGVAAEAWLKTHLRFANLLQATADGPLGKLARDFADVSPGSYVLRRILVDYMETKKTFGWIPMLDLVSEEEWIEDLRSAAKAAFNEMDPMDLPIST